MADMDKQPKEDLTSTDAISKIKELAERCGICLFHTAFPSGTATDAVSNCRPMALQGVDEAGTLWFLSSSESDKNHEIKENHTVLLTFQNNANSEFLELTGLASIHQDKATIEAHWTEFANAWFEGKDDPRVRVISVSPVSGHYWDTKNGKLWASIKMIFSAVAGAKMDDGGVDGELKI